MIQIYNKYTFYICEYIFFYKFYKVYVYHTIHDEIYNTNKNKIKFQFTI